MIEETVLRAITNYGFPIIAFLLIYYQSNTTIKDNTKAIQANSISNKELITYLREKR